MTQNYHEYTEYMRYADFKRLDFIVNAIINHFSGTNHRGVDLGCGKGNVTVPLGAFTLPNDRGWI